MLSPKTNLKGFFERSKQHSQYPKGVHLLDSPSDKEGYEQNYCSKMCEIGGFFLSSISLVAYLTEERGVWLQLIWAQASGG